MANGIRRQTSHTAGALTCIARTRAAFVTPAFGVYQTDGARTFQTMGAVTVIPISAQLAGGAARAETATIDIGLITVPDPIRTGSNWR